MPEDCIPYADTGYFSNLILDYLAEDPAIRFLYHRFPTSENFKLQLEDKKGFPQKNRDILADVLEQQYSGIPVSASTKKSITALRSENTFTITTGHQLNLFTGPLYFLYKIVSTVNLCKELQQAYPEFTFVPVYWMATEDHDFEEINHFNFQGKKVVWDRDAGGAVGELSTEGLEEVLATFRETLGDSLHAKKLQALFEEAYLSHPNLADATRHLANALFGEQGLVIVDGNEKALKELFLPYMKEELLENTSARYVEATNTKINRISGKNYKLQATPREINLFYLHDGLRERIVIKDGIFYGNTSVRSFDEEALLQELHNHPERFSPNVILRPLYQEVVLPNLCYIGGGGELAYWLQLQSFFQKTDVPFPILLLRNSALLVPKKTRNKIEKLPVSIPELFLPTHELETLVTHRISKIAIDFSTQREHLQQQFKDLYTLAGQTDASFLGAVAAQEKKQLNGLDNLEKRLLRAQKRKLADQLERITALQSALFPNGNLQERTHNFSEWYVEYGDELLTQLQKALRPLDSRFTTIVL